MRVLLRASLLTGLAVSCLLADASYDQSVKYTGGTLLDMIRAMPQLPFHGGGPGGGARAAFQDQTYKIYLKGAKMARIGDLSSTIYDLDAGTVTTINTQRHTYSVRTFDEMRQQMQKMQQHGNHGQSGDVDFDVKVVKTGQTRTIDGQTASEAVITMTAKSASANGQMVVKSDLWLLPPDSARQELTDYEKRLGEKFAEALSGGGGFGGVGAGIGAAMKETFKMGGFPALDDIEVSGISSPMARGNADPGAPLIKMETQFSNFASGQVDDSKFSVPAGYTQETRHRE